MSTQFVTEFVSEQPLMVVVGLPSELTRQLISQVSSNGVEVVHLNPAKSPLSKETLNNAYKVVWVNEEIDLSSELYQVTASQLIRVDAKCVVIQPVMTAVKRPQNQNAFGYEWSEGAGRLKELILDINYRLPQAGFIFGLNILDSGSLSASPFSFILKEIKNGWVGDPDIELGVQDAIGFAKAAAQLLFRPQSSGSFLVRPSLQRSRSVLDQIVRRYQQYHGVNIEVRDAAQVLDENIPFSVMSIESSPAGSEVFADIARSLPAPVFNDLPRVDSVLENTLPKPGAVLNAREETLLSPPPGSTVQTPALQAYPKPNSETVPELQQKTTPAGAPSPKAQEELTSVPAARTEEKKEPAIPASNSQENFDLNQELQKIFAETRAGQRVGRIKSKAKTEKKQRRKKKQRTTLFWGGMASIAAASIILIMSVVFFSTQLLMKRSLRAVIADASQVEASELAEKESWSNLSRVNKFMVFQTNLYSGILSSSMFSQAEMLLQVTRQIEGMSSSIGQTRETSETLVLQILGIQGGNSVETAQKLQSHAAKTYENLSLLQAGLGQLSLGGKDADVNGLIKQYETQIRNFRQGLATTQQIEPHLAALTGMDGKKTYALLLQNNQELRPTGGFIQAVALLSFDRGSLVSYEVYSSYELDSKLTGGVAPPEEVSEFLGEDSWYLRDSNWNPHFPDTARQASWFIEQSLGKSVDGVIGINLLVMEDLIEALGPVEVAEFNEIITHRNVQERMEYHSEVVLVPENGQKDYGVIVLEGVIEKMKKTQAQKVRGFLSALGKNLESQQMTFVVFDENVESTLSSLGWTGGLIEPQCPSQLSVVDCQVDAIAQIEANVGVNKANYYLKRSINHNISLGSELADHQRIITFQNTAKTAAWPKGDYEAYIRFYLPNDAEFSSLSIDGGEITGSALKQYDEGGKKVVGALINVPVDSTVQLEMNYSTPLVSAQPFSYVFFNQKQSGTEETPLMVKLISSSSIIPTLIAPQAEVADNTIIFDNIQDKHTIVGVTYE